MDEIFEYSDKGILFCRDISKKNIYINNNEVLSHSHIILFNGDSIKLLINAEKILIDGTFIALKAFYQTIIIMYLDPIYCKMIPAFFATINNKTIIGYNEIFKVIKNFILNHANHNKDNIKWVSFTTDFEIDIFTSFKMIFSFLPNLHHIGCYFHFMKNIRSYLQKNGFTSNRYRSL